MRVPSISIIFLFATIVVGQGTTIPGGGLCPQQASVPHLPERLAVFFVLVSIILYAYLALTHRNKETFPYKVVFILLALSLLLFLYEFVGFYNFVHNGSLWHIVNPDSALLNILFNNGISVIGNYSHCHAIEVQGFIIPPIIWLVFYTVCFVWYFKKKP